MCIYSVYFKGIISLEAKKAELQEENAAFEEINENLHEQLLQIGDEIHSLQENVENSRCETEKAQKQAARRKHNREAR